MRGRPQQLGGIHDALSWRRALILQSTLSVRAVLHKHCLPHAADHHSTPKCRVSTSILCPSSLSRLWAEPVAPTPSRQQHVQSSPQLTRHHSRSSRYPSRIFPSAGVRVQQPKAIKAKGGCHRTKTLINYGCRIVMDRTLRVPITHGYGRLQWPWPIQRG